MIKAKGSARPVKVFCRNRCSESLGGPPTADLMVKDISVETELRDKIIQNQKTFTKASHTIGL